MGLTRRGVLAAMLPAGPVLAVDALMIQGRRLAELLSQPEAAGPIAAAYLAGIGETDWRRAAIGLNMPAVLAPAGGITGTSELRAWLGARIRADFAAGAMLGVDGWQLSRTEIGVCVLVAGVA